MNHPKAPSFVQEPIRIQIKYFIGVIISQTLTGCAYFSSIWQTPLDKAWENGIQCASEISSNTWLSTPTEFVAPNCVVSISPRKITFYGQKGYKKLSPHAIFTDEFEKICTGLGRRKKFAKSPDINVLKRLIRNYRDIEKGALNSTNILSHYTPSFLSSVEKCMHVTENLKMAKEKDAFHRILSTGKRVEALRIKSSENLKHEARLLEKSVIKSGDILIKFNILFRNTGKSPYLFASSCSVSQMYRTYSKHYFILDEYCPSAKAQVTALPPNGVYSQDVEIILKREKSKLRPIIFFGALPQIRIGPLSHF